MSLRRETRFINQVQRTLEFVAQEIQSNCDFVTEIKRRIIFPYDQNYNFSYVLTESGDFALTESGDKIIRQ